MQVTVIIGLLNFTCYTEKFHNCNHTTVDELFITMTEAFEKSSLMTCSTSIVNESLTGLMRNHVYTITRGKFCKAITIVI